MTAPKRVTVPLPRAPLARHRLHTGRNPRACCSPRLVAVEAEVHEFDEAIETLDDPDVVE